MKNKLLFLFFFLLFILCQSKIHLKKKIIDTTKEKQFSFEHLQKINENLEIEEERQFLIQFHEKQDIKGVENKLKLKVLHYIPDNGFVVFGKGSEILKKRQDSKEIKWIGHFDPEYKTLLNFSNLKSEKKNTDKITFYVMTNQNAEHKFENWKRLLNEKSNEIRKVTNQKYAIEVSPEHSNDVLNYFKKDELVHWIELKEEYTTNNFAAHSITQSGIPFQQKNTPIWDHGITGKDEIVGIGDTGIDWDMCFFHDKNIPLPINKIDHRHRKIVGYYQVSVFRNGKMEKTDTKDYASGHGTHTSGSIAGSVEYDNPSTVEKLKPYNGMAYNAKLLFTDLMGADPALILPETLDDGYFPIPYSGGARIHSNSWGCSFPVNCQYDCNCVFTVDIPQLGIVKGSPATEEWCVSTLGASCCKYCNQYSQQTLEVDRFAYNHDDFLIIFAAGNIGHFSHDSTIASPATCKNCLSVGASHTSNQNFIDAIDHTDFSVYFKLLKISSTDECCAFTSSDPSYQKRVREACCPSVIKELYKNTKNFNENNLSFFSGRGPTFDGRFKPEIVAPGYQVQSTHSDGIIDSFQCGVGQPNDNNNASVLTMRGTSMATPVVSGNAALVREYFRRGFYPSGTAKKEDEMKAPSSALLRGAIIHSGSPLNGVVNYDYKGTLHQLAAETYPNLWSGYGLLTLQNVLKFPESKFKLFVKDRKEISNGQNDKYCVKVKNNGPIKITLVWTDPPATTSASISLVNNLDLLAYDDHEHFGNNRMDDRNTAEQIELKNVKAGQTIAILVKGSHIPIGPQKYALVITSEDFEFLDDCKVPFVLFSYTFLLDIMSYVMFGLILIVLFSSISIFAIYKYKTWKKSSVVNQQIEREEELHENQDLEEENVYFE
eukprot:gene9435-1641_t